VVIRPSLTTVRKCLFACAARRSGWALDLIETDGAVSWSWTPGDGSTQFCRNVIAPDSHLFVSTDRAVHAIDPTTRKSVWSIPVPGTALSANGTLLINEGCRESTGRMVAVRMPRR